MTESGNVKTRIKTGYQYEEIKKVQIIGELAELLALIAELEAILKI